MPELNPEALNQRCLKLLDSFGVLACTSEWQSERSAITRDLRSTLARTPPAPSEASILRCPQCGVDPSGPTMGEAVEMLRKLEAVGRDSFWQRRCLFCHGHVAYGKVVHDPTCRLGTFLDRCGVKHE